MSRHPDSQQHTATGSHHPNPAEGESSAAEQPVCREAAEGTGPLASVSHPHFLCTSPSLSLSLYSFILSLWDPVRVTKLRLERALGSGWRDAPRSSSSVVYLSERSQPSARAPSLSSPRHARRCASKNSSLAHRFQANTDFKQVQSVLHVNQQG